MKTFYLVASAAAALIAGSANAASVTVTYENPGVEHSTAAFSQSGVVL